MNACFFFLVLFPFQVPWKKLKLNNDRHSIVRKLLVELMYVKG